MLGELVAGGCAGLAPLAAHIRTADANPDEIEVRALGGCGAAGGGARST